MNNFYEAKVIAGQSYVAPYSGQFFAISDTGAARSVSLRFVVNGSEQNLIKNMTSGFETQMAFDRVIFQSDVDTVISFFASSVPVRLGNRDGMQVGVKALEPLPVIVDGTFTPVVGDVTVINSEADPLPTKIIGTLAVEQNRLTVISNIAPVALTVANTAQKISGDATLKRLEIRNAHETAKICIGGAGVTFENAVIVLLPNDVWVESDAPGADWYAVADTAGAKVALQGKK